MKDIRDSALATTLDRLILCLMLVALAGVLTAAMGFQYLNGEIPCPLCLLERVAMFACCFGLIRQLRDGGSQRGAGIAMLSAVLLLDYFRASDPARYRSSTRTRLHRQRRFRPPHGGMVRPRRGSAADRVRGSAGGSWRPEVGAPGGKIHAIAPELRSWSLCGDILRDQPRVCARSVRLWPMSHDGICLAALTGRPGVRGLFPWL